MTRASFRTALRRPLGLAVATALLVVLRLAVATTGHAAPLGRTLHPLSAQTTDQAIASDLALMDAWHAKLDGLANAERNLWRMHAARAWLDVARAEYADNDRTGFPQAAFARAVALIEDIERDEPPFSFETVPAAVPPAGSIAVTDSVIAELERMKRDPGFLCAAEELARIETELARAGNEGLDLGDCMRSPHLANARHLARIATRKVDLCGPPLLAVRRPPPPAPAPQLVVPDTVPVTLPKVEELQIPMTVHFGLDRFDITPESRTIIKDIAAVLAKHPSITVHLVGHTDSRGDTAYNLRLSQRRVQAVLAVFVELGIDPQRTSTAHVGKSRLRSAEDSRRGLALNRRVEMTFVDAEGRDIRGLRQTRDLQIEADKKPKKKKVRKPTAKKRRKR